MTALHDLAYTRQAQGDLDEAEQQFQQVREYRSDKLGRDHPNTLITAGLAEHHRTSVERHGLANDSPGQSIGHDQPRLASSQPGAEPADQGFSLRRPRGETGRLLPPQSTTGATVTAQPSERTWRQEMTLAAIAGLISGTARAITVKILEYLMSS